MTEIINIHPQNPQKRLIEKAADIIKSNGLIIYPTDSSYAFGWAIDNKNAQEKVKHIRKTDQNHNFTMICSDLSDIANYAKIDNLSYRLLKAHTPGPYTYILPATKEIPRRLRNPKKKSIGIRVPDHPVAHDIIEVINEPLMSSTIFLPGRIIPLTEIEDFPSELTHYMDLIIDSGNCGHQPTTVVNLMSWPPAIIRKGKGEHSFLE